MVAAVASYLEAKRGQWLLRIEDVDQPRSVAGMAALQQGALDAYGFAWNGEVVQQSARETLYKKALTTLIEAGYAYPCTCTRSQLAGHTDARFGIDGARIYPGTCSHWQLGDVVPDGAAWRFRVGDQNAAEWSFTDVIQGVVRQQLARDVGDFVLHRADGCTTYQLAVVVDDLAQGVTQVVRGADLLDSTARQMALITALGGRVPEYVHVPVAVNADGEKLSKQTLATAIPIGNEEERVAQLWHVLDFLGQDPPIELAKVTQSALWCWAKLTWRIEKVAKQRCLALPVSR
jgi:glutamyl-Q tRNA(Asp) synthetase